MPKIDWLKHISKSDFPTEREYQWFMEGYKDEDALKDRPDLNKFPWSTMFHVMEWTKPTKTWYKRMGWLTKRLEDPVEMGLGFQPSVVMGVGGEGGYGIAKAAEMAERGEVTVKGTPIFEKLRKMLKNPKLFSKIAGAAGGSKQMYLPKTQPAWERPGAMLKAHTPGRMGGETDFLTRLEQSKGAEPGKALSIIQKDRRLADYLPRWLHDIKRKSTWLSDQNPYGQALIAQEYQPGINLSEIRQFPASKQREMLAKFTHGIEEFIGTLEKDYKIRLYDQNWGNVGMKSDGTPVFWDVGINTPMDKDFFKFGNEPSTQEYIRDIVRTQSGMHFSKDVRPYNPMSAARVYAKVKRGQVPRSQYKDPNIWKSIGQDTETIIDLEDAALKSSTSSKPLLNSWMNPVPSGTPIMEEIFDSQGNMMADVFKKWKQQFQGYGGKSEIHLNTMARELEDLLKQQIPNSTRQWADSTLHQLKMHMADRGFRSSPIRLGNLVLDSKTAAELSNTELIANAAKLDRWMRKSRSRTGSFRPEVWEPVERSLQYIEKEMAHRQQAWRSPVRVSMSEAERAAAQKEMDQMSKFMQGRGEVWGGTPGEYKSFTRIGDQMRDIPGFGMQSLPPGMKQQLGPEWRQTITPPWERAVNREVRQFRDIVKDLYGDITF